MESFAEGCLLPLAADEPKLHTIRNRSNPVTKSIVIVLCFISSALCSEAIWSQIGKGTWSPITISALACPGCRATSFDLFHEVLSSPGQKKRYGATYRYRPDRINIRRNASC